MKGLMQLINILVSLAGFLLVCGMLLARGESFITAVTRAVMVFVALWVAQGLLSSLLGIAVHSDSPARQDSEERR